MTPTPIFHFRLPPYLKEIITSVKGSRTATAFIIEAIQEKIKKEKRNIEPPEESEIDYGPYGEGGFVNYK